MSASDSNLDSSVARKIRVAIVAFLLAVPTLLLLVRLFQLQLKDSAQYQETVRSQTHRTILKSPVRGQIFSADNELLAGNRAHYDLTLHPSEMRHPGGERWTAAYMMNIATWLDEKIFHRRGEWDIPTLRRLIQRDMSQPIVLYKDITDQERAIVSDYLPQIPGVHITPRNEREYPHPGTAVHLLGYCGWQWRKNSQGRHIFQSKELLGNAGLEKQYDDVLAGKTGPEFVLIDPIGFVRETLVGSREPENGNDIQLTIQFKAQTAAEQALDGLHGALVCLDIHTGEVIAMASAPSYTVDDIAGPRYSELLTDTENLPLFHRALNGSYMPGSIVKPLVALAALENGITTTEEEYECIGHYLLGNKKIHCANRYGHGELTLERAIAVSCNPFFIDLGIRCTLDKLEPFYRAAGFGEFCGFDLPESTRGICPSKEAAEKANRKWLVGDTAYASIGQGLIEITPLQAACYTAALANGGTLLRPYIVQRILHPDGSVLQETAPQIRGTIPSSPQNIAIVQEAMIQAVEMPGASAYAMRRAPMPLAAKTGTAEVGTGPAKRHNTWIICYGPLPSPEFAVACVIEDGVSGAMTTAPVVLKFLSLWKDEE